MKFKITRIFLAIFTIFSFLNLKAFAFNEDEILVPNALKKGDKVCLLSMSYVPPWEDPYFYKEPAKIAIEKLKSYGLEVDFYEESFKVSEFVGDDTAQLRADLFNKAVKDKSIKAIFDIKGGFCAIQTLDKIDYEAFRENKKIFVGYSDASIVGQALFKKSGVITFHGPMLGARYHLNEMLCFNNLFDILMNPKSEFELKNIDDGTPFKIYKGGNCEGRIAGGNHWEMQHLMGTPYEIEFKDKIFFFEDDWSDVSKEEAYRVNSAMWQMLILNKNIEKLSGIIAGPLARVGTEGEEVYRSSVFEAFGEAKVPVLYNFHIGHINNPLTVPIGARAKIENGRVFITQPVVQ